MRHFHYFEEGIAIFSPTHHKLYANPRFTQYVNALMDRPTPDVEAIWQTETFAPALEFLRLNGGPRSVTEEAPVFRFNTKAGSMTLGVQILVYSDGNLK